MPSWTFQQLGGDRKRIELGDYAAPFGRPRKDPVAKELIKVNIQTIRYPGSKNPPTRHIFGSGWEPMELRGRWMTRMLTTKTAEEYADEFVAFVRDERQIRLTWGNIVSYQGYINELELGRESQDEIAWRITVLVDKRENAAVIRIRSPKINILEFRQILLDRISNIKLPSLPDMAPNIFEQLDFLAGQLKRYTALFADLANEFDRLEKATFSTIQSFRGIGANILSAMAAMETIAMNNAVDSVILIRRPDSVVNWQEYQLNLDVELTVIRALLADLDRKLEIVAKSDVSKFVTAIQGESWERLAVRVGLGPDSAPVIRDANGVRYGSLPEAGTIYLVPDIRI